MITHPKCIFKQDTHAEWRNFLIAKYYLRSYHVVILCNSSRVATRRIR